MGLWLIILGTALASGLLVLHTFGKAKEIREGMLGVYRDLLNEALKEDEKKELHSGAEASEAGDSSDTPSQI